MQSCSRLELGRLRPYYFAAATSPVSLVELVLELYPVQTKGVKEALQHVHTQDNAERYGRKNRKT